MTSIFNHLAVKLVISAHCYHFTAPLVWKIQKSNPSKAKHFSTAKTA